MSTDNEELARDAQAPLHAATPSFVEHECPETLPPPIVGKRRRPSSISSTPEEYASQEAGEDSPRLRETSSTQGQIHRSPLRPTEPFVRTERTPTPAPRLLSRADTTSCRARRPKPRSAAPTPLQKLVDLAKSDDRAEAKPGGTVQTPLVDTPPLLSSLVSSSSPAPAYMADLVVSDALRSELTRCLGEHEQRSELHRYGLKPLGTLLLTGPAGTGKSLFARVIAGELSLPLHTIRLESLFYVSSSEAEPRNYYNKIGVRQKYLVDTIRRNRAVYVLKQTTLPYQGMQARSDPLVHQLFLFISELLRAVQYSDSHSITVVTFPQIAEVPRDVLRYFDMILKFQLPSLDQSIQVMQNRLMTMETTQVDWQQIAHTSEGLSHAEIAQGAERAAKLALLNNGGTVSTELLVSCIKRQQQLYIQDS
ncbi:MAG: ATP-binding protein [Myxococcales bacterium]|nr:ATP-binding protein [Myxococcales bacterium]